MKFKTITTVVAFFAAFLMTGCATKELGPATNTGFFQEYKTTVSEIKATPPPTKYTKIKLSTVQIVSGIEKSEESASQKKMYKEISEYLTSEYKKIVANSARYTLATKNAEDTIVLKSAISTVEIHSDDSNWNKLTLIAMGLDTISFNAYMYEFVRVLGDSKLVDSMTGKLVSRSMKIQHEHKINITGDDLVFSDVKPALDSWLAQIKVDLSSK